MKEALPANARSFLLIVSILSSCVIQAFGYYHPGAGRWMSRDPIGEDGFYTTAVPVIRDRIVLSSFLIRIEAPDGQIIVEDPLYVALSNDPLSRIDYLGLALSSLDGAIEACLALPTPSAKILCLSDLSAEGCNSCRIKSLIEAQKRLLTKAGDLIRGSLKGSKSYHSELETETYEKILEIAKGTGDQAKRAQQMKKLIEQSRRLLEKCK